MAEFLCKSSCSLYLGQILFNDNNDGGDTEPEPEPEQFSFVVGNIRVLVIVSLVTNRMLVGLCHLW